mmetsp:Transcript_1416/g.3774  ORF Transcript_1416/g.3774 Transcript_1416/m.3774 type:complete len:232 (+) Transcript_1416:76-771(+)
MMDADDNHRHHLDDADDESHAFIEGVEAGALKAADDNEHDNGDGRERDAKERPPSLVWEWQAARDLRQQCGLVAAEIGTLPIACQQNKQLGAPFLYSDDQTTAIRHMQRGSRSSNGRRGESGGISVDEGPASALGKRKRQDEDAVCSSVRFSMAGLKFGGTSVMYTGDPLKYHGFVLIQRVPHSSLVSSVSLLRTHRVATAMHKEMVVEVAGKGVAGGETKYLKLDRLEYF